MVEDEVYITIVENPIGVDLKHEGNFKSNTTHLNSNKYDLSGLRA
jgi:hypothetical protein